MIPYLLGSSFLLFLIFPQTFSSLFPRSPYPPQNLLFLLFPLFLISPKTFSSLFSRSFSSPPNPLFPLFPLSLFSFFTPLFPLFPLSLFSFFTPLFPLSYKAKLTQSFLFHPNILQQLFFLHEYLINRHTLKTVNKSR
ncbi:hypothetical protein [Photobacterium damselae]|uniref:hypothetical protein n=1 Tax=Photobacterium damselae TaxID=38293 RepID=UPI0015A278C5|nr:hypothetical protein [Photobacterium damselae]NVO61544.1 hypothetical protein [Photobacterium damselae subsp. damselae]